VFILEVHYARPSTKLRSDGGNRPLKDPVNVCANKMEDVVFFEKNRCLILLYLFIFPLDLGYLFLLLPQLYFAST
jgi:hypothetical protein